jgi:hypothetical protein
LVGVFSGDKKLAEGASYNIKRAKQEAARAALRTHYSQELGDGTLELPSRWGDYGVDDTKDYIREAHQSSTKDPEA